MPVLHFRRYEARLAGEGELAPALKGLLEYIGVQRVRFFFEGTPGCERIVARFPELARFLVKNEKLLNFDGMWDVSNPAVANDVVPRDVLLAIASGIPEEFPLASVVLVIGPGDLELPGRPVPEGSPPFSTRFPSLTYISPGVILQRLSSENQRDDHRANRRSRSRVFTEGARACSRAGGRRG